MILVPKFPSIPQLSIIVPVGNDPSAFEDTLLSVLENRPDRCEVIVPHDGRYDDPFDLSDEVRLVVAEGGNFVDTVLAGARAARGEFVHVLAAGLQATAGWADVALERFRHREVAAVAPVVRCAENRRVVSAGWTDTSAMLFQPVAAGRSDVDANRIPEEVGAYLAASFWRRSVFLSLGDAFLYNGGHDAESVSETSYVFYQLLRGAGWQASLASDCDVISAESEMAGERASVERGRRIGAAKRHFEPATASLSLVGMIQAAIGTIVRSGECGQWFGRATSGKRVEKLCKRLRPEIVQCLTSDVQEALPLDGLHQTHRRAA
tara:strand:+ start:470171 stop:471133 length:963 start_codon:yes stop_codon:yes gene_type:complete